ncbi:tributyrin esterase [Spirochaetia bacterium]|nr:tributyrin esterase [Spirochaetia bacterium]
MTFHGSVYSKVLGFKTGISVFAPDNFVEKSRCKVVYLLHGLHGNSQTWLSDTMLSVYAGDSNAVFIMPEVGRSFYTNMKHGLNYFMYIGEELPEIVKNVFNISSKREDTAVIGCSMGGYGALKLALSKPGQYGFCGAISPACLFISKYLEQLKKEGQAWAAHSPDNAAILRDFYAIFGEDLEYNKKDDIFSLAKEISQLKKKPKIYAACGKEDDLLEENRQFNHAVKELKLDYTFDEWTGRHDWNFFNEALQKTLNAWKN